MLMAQPSLDVRELLASSEPASLAWGAELAARNQATEFVPQLIGLLHSTDERVREHALDALIRLKARVPEEELRGLLPRFSSSVILLAVNGGQKSLLLSMLRGNSGYDPNWVALNEALLAGGGLDYWNQLLREWTIHVVVHVVQPRHTAKVERLGSGWCGDSVRRDLPDFPERASYDLVLSPEPGDTILFSAPYRVYIRRSPVPHGCGVPIDRDEYRAAFVKSAVHETFSIEGKMRFEIDWTGAQAYLAETKRLRAKVRAGVQDITEQLGTTVRPRIEVTVQDQRADKSHALPPTPPWE
jgi:hypothetical protein